MMINEAKIKIKGLGYKIAGSSTLTVTEVKSTRSKDLNILLSLFTICTLDIQVQSKITHGIIIVSTVYFFREDIDDACLMSTS
jgi:hypothetical protein